MSAVSNSSQSSVSVSPVSSLSLDQPQDDQDMITLVAAGDKKTFKVPRKFAYISDVVKTAFEDKDSKEVSVNVQSNILEKIVKYMNHHKGNEPKPVEKPLKSKHMIKNCEDPFDAEFIDEIGDSSMKELYDLVTAANYMGMNTLLHLGCAKIGSLIKGEPLERIQAILKVPVSTASKDASTESNTKMEEKKQ